MKHYRADLVRNIVLVIAYVVFARISLFFSIGEGNISTIWLPAGIAAAAILAFGPRILPGVWLGEVIGNLYTGLSPSILVFYGLGNVAEAWIFYTVVHRTAGAEPFYCRLSGVAGFALGAGVACIAAAVAGVSTLYAFGGTLPAEFAGNVAIWWVGDVIGILVATPLIVAWSRPSALKFPQRYLAEYGLFYVALVFTAYFIFSTWFSPAITRGMPYLVLIFIVWAVFRLGERHVTAASALAGVFAVRAVITGTGPFSGQTLAIQLFTTEGFIAITSITGIILIAVVAERRSVDEELRKSRDDLEKRVNARTEELSRDIARRVSAEEALKQSERRLADIIDFIPDAVMVIDRQGTVTTWNRAMEDLTGVPAPDMIGKSDHEYAIPFYGVRRPVLADLVLEPGATVHDLYPGMIRKDGDIFIAEVTLEKPDGKKQVLWGKASPIYDGNGEIAGAIESIRDITDLKETEAALKKSHSLLEDAMDQAHMATWEADPREGVFIFNDRLYALFGTTAEREGGYRMPTEVYLREFLYPGDTAIVSREIEKAIRTTDPQFASESEHRIIRRDGVVRYVMVRVRITKDAEGRTVRAFGVTQDITERAEAETALKQSNFLLEDAMDQAHMAYWEFDVPTGIFTFNDRFYALYGTTAEQEGGYFMPAAQYAAKFVYPGDSGVVAREVEKAIAATDPDYLSEVEHRIIRRDGELRHIVVRIRITKDAEGRTVRTHGANQDITELKRAETALKQSNFLLEDAMDQAHMATWEFDVPAGIFTFNDRFYALYGTTAEREGGYLMSVDRYAREFVHPDDNAMVSREVEKAINAADPGYLSEVEHRIIRRDGETRNIVVRIRITKDAEGRTVRTHGANQDITERKRAEIALSEAKRATEESLALFTTLFENSPVGFGFVDTDFRAVITNSVLAGYSPVPRDEQTGKMLVELIPDYWPALEPIFRQVLNSGVPVTGIDVPGEEVPRSVMAQRFLANLYPIRIRGDKTIGIGVIVVDVTRLKAVEDALRRSRDYYLKLFDEFPNPIWRSDLSGTFDYFNREWLSFTGRALPEEVRDGWKKDLHPEDLQPFEKTYSAAFATRTTFELEFRLRHGDGTFHWVFASGKPFYDLEGEFSGYLGACYDIQDRKRTELALQAVNRKLNLLSSITRHDIINQVTAMRGYLELSHEIPLDPELAGFIKKEEQIAEAIERQILFTRDYQDMGVKSPVWQDVRKTIANAMSGLPMRNCTVEVEFHGLEVYADPLFEKVFFNLIDNALRYGGEKMSAIRFTARREGREEVIVCEDDGEGISPADKVHLFERGRGKHTGLGLFLSREILAITGIAIRETSDPGKGARFEISVPEGTYRWAEEKRE